VVYFPYYRDSGSAGFGGTTSFSPSAEGGAGAWLFGASGSTAGPGLRAVPGSNSSGPSANAIEAYGNEMSNAAGYWVYPPSSEFAGSMLQHAYVGSSEMKNVYDGVVTLDTSGVAVVRVPDYVPGLNRDFRYQLTPIGASMPNLYISSELTDKSFTIAGGTPDGKVSWQVTGIRKDAWANQNPIQLMVPARPAPTPPSR